MKMKDIEKRFTEMVSKYISEGYTINLSTMSGSQGEVGKVDLIRDDHFIRISVDRKEEYISSLRHITFSVGEIEEFHQYNYDTVWYRDLTTVYEKKYYRVGEDWYVESKDKATESRILHYTRSRNQSRSVWYWDESKSIASPKTIEIAVKYLKRVAKCQRVFRDEIQVVHYFDSVGVSEYYIKYKGQTFHLR